MNMQQLHSGAVMKPCAVLEWENAGTTIVVDRKKFWPADDWKRFVRLWSAGVPRKSLEALFAPRDFKPIDIDNLAALIASNCAVLPPIPRALFILAGLAAHDESAPGGFTIAGRPARSAEVVRAANRVLSALGHPQIRYPNAEA